MSSWISAAAGGVILAAIVSVCWMYWRTRRTIDKIDRMLDAAADGTFSENTFDESRLSALETKFSAFLSADLISRQRIDEEKNKIKTLIADISHQTKTPIANILLYSELLQEEDLPEAALDNVEALHFQTEKLQFLIASLIKLSRLENGFLSLMPQKRPVMPMLEDVCSQYVIPAEQKALRLLLEPTDAYAVFDTKWTAEALCNILDNAVKYTSQGGITVSVVCYGMYIRIDIADTGIGIAEPEHAKIFTRFYRPEETRDREGVGIGLYLAREIISAESGYIKLTSKKGEGAVFSVFLPSINQTGEGFFQNC